jgi:hypothetical protein
MRRSNSRRSSLSQCPVGLNVELEKSLAAYASAAVATGVSFLAITSSAHAEIVYTPAHTRIPPGPVAVPLDLNHDGVADFSFFNSLTTNGAPHLRLAPKTNNEMWGRGGGGSIRFASALPAGRKVGADKTYFGTSTNGTMAGLGGTPSGSGTTTWGQWLFTKRRYLGLKFVINGQIHYGWARVDVPDLRHVVLTGYAYETIPGKPIITGKTKAADVVALEPAGLGRLAQGSAGRLGKVTTRQ